MIEQSQLSNIRSLRKLASEMGDDAFLEFAEKVEVIKGEVNSRIAEEEEKKALVEEKLKATTELLQGEGFNVSLESVRALLLGQVEAPAASEGKGKGKGGKGVKRGSVEPKYAYTVDGAEHTWTGRGRMPLALKEMVDSGKDLDSFLIKKD